MRPGEHSGGMAPPPEPDPEVRETRPASRRFGAAGLGMLVAAVVLAAQPAASAEPGADSSGGSPQTRITGRLQLGTLSFDGTEGVAAAIRQQGYACDSVASLQVSSARGVRVCCEGGAACYAITGEGETHTVRPE